MGGNVTRRLLGDPDPGRTPWAAPGPPARQTFTARPVAASAPPTPPADPEEGAAAAVAAPPEEAADPMRPIAPLALEDPDFLPIATAAPAVEWMAPADLLVDRNYQRDLSPASIKLVRRIAERWDWRRFKPPVIAWTERGFEIIDGQHTAIGAATRGIERIPVLVVEAVELEDRALAFIGHNRDRLVVTATQMHHAAVAAQDPEAVRLQNVCDQAGATLIRTVYGSRAYKPGETLAISAIDGLIRRQGDSRSRAVLETLVQAGCAPITANAIKAAEMLMTGPDYADRFEPADLVKAIVALGDTADGEAKLYADANCVPRWKGLAVVWFRKTRKRAAP